MEEGLLKIAAIHEAGHVLMAYQLGLRINSVSLNTGIPGEGVCSISWLKDQKIINILTKPVFQDERPGLSKLGHPYLKELAIKFIRIFCAGTGAEVAYEIQNGGQTTVTNINGADNDTIADFIDALKEIGIEIPDEVVSKQFTFVAHVFSIPEYLSLILKLANMILAKENLSLDYEELNSFLSNIQSQ